MMEHLPILIFGLLAGVAVDRLNRRHVMLGSSLIRGALMAGIPLIALGGGLNIGIILTWAFIFAIAVSLFLPARDSLIPQLAPESDRLRANTLVQGSEQFAWFLGPLIAAGLLGWVGAVQVFWGAALLFALSFILLRLMRLPDDLPAATGQDALIGAGETGGPSGARLAWQDAREGLALVWHHRELRWLLILTAVNNFFIMGPAIVAMPIYIRQDLGLGGSYYAGIEAVLAIGMLTSSAMLLKGWPRLSKGRLWLAGMTADGLTYGPMFLAPIFPWLVPLIFVHAFFIPWITISRVSLVQDLVPDGMRGRVFSFMGMSVVGMTALSAGVTGLLLDLVPTHLLFGSWGMLGMICGLIGFAVPRLRRL
jgi:MFS transporter, DHA3 family, macrolide efflux protein